MSNKNVPGFFRTVVDEVAKNIENDFREYGVSQDVLSELKTLWMEKIISAHVADFQAETVTVAQQPAHAAFAAHPITHPHMMLNPAAYATAMYANAAAAAVAANTVKSEPNEPRYILNPPAGTTYALPALPGPTLGQRTTGQPATPANVLTYQAPRYPATTPNVQSSSANPSSPSIPQIPQVDGPSSYESEDDDEEPGPSQSQYAPRTSHPSLPQPQQQQKKASADDEAINSDLDDSEDDEGAGDEGPTASDIMFCTYDKVARVKNKWKCVLKDGIVHVNGKDYLFQKCTGEFEW